MQNTTFIVTPEDPMRADEFMRKYGFDKEDDEQVDHSLRGQALERARHPENMHVGTPHDWEDLERYLQQETPTPQTESQTDLQSTSSSQPPEDDPSKSQ